MNYRHTQNNESPEPGGPPPLKPDNVLDSILGEQGPMPTAKLSLRALALALDGILVIAIASIIIWKVVLPQSHPAAFGELLKWSQALTDWYQSGAAGTMPEPSKTLLPALSVANEIQLLICWLYFALGEALFAGSSLGKRICRIRSVSTVTLEPPPMLAGIIRGGLKTITLFWLFPIAFAVSLLALMFNQRRQLGHDLCARTVVIDEKYAQAQTLK